jgi:hypothetical protein
MPLRYRERGQFNWYEGRTENISRSGLLFLGQHSIDPNTPVEMRFSLPVKVPNDPTAEIICFGHIVRTVAPSNGQSLPGLAARISDYRVVRVQDVAGE